MPKNLKGGNKAKRQGNKNTNLNKIKDTPEPNNNENQHVGIVTKVLGDCRFTVKILSNNGYKNEEMISWLSAGKKRIGRVANDSYILVSKRDFEDKCDILYLYDRTDIENLYKNKIIEKEIKEENDDELFIIGNEDDLNIDDI